MERVGGYRKSHETMDGARAINHATQSLYLGDQIQDSDPINHCKVHIL